MKKETKMEENNNFWMIDKKIQVPDTYERQTCATYEWIAEAVPRNQWRSGPEKTILPLNTWVRAPRSPRRKRTEPRKNLNKKLSIRLRKHRRWKSVTQIASAKRPLITTGF